MKYDHLKNREDVDHEHVIKVGSVTVYFLKESDGKSLNEATKLLVDAYEERMKSAA